MKDIDELIGIVKGINFDGIVNEKEVNYLTVWVHENRDLAYDMRQAYLLDLIDKVLEDRIITNEERETLLNCCLGFQKNFSNIKSKTHELNGIIGGIICDKVINKCEIEQLKTWIGLNNGYLTDDKNSQEVLELINKILKDDIVTEDEHKMLLDYLEDRIENLKFNEKIDQLVQKVKARKNIGLLLIDMLDDEKSINKIHNYAQNQLKVILSSYTKDYSFNHEIVFISLVLIGMLYYDGNYYEHVKNVYKELYDLYNDQRIEGRIRSILSEFQTTNNKKTRYISFVLENSIVPKYFLKSFIYFIEDIYKVNFEYELSDDLFEDFRFIYDGLRSCISKNEQEDLRLDVTRKTYKLIKTTQNVLLDPSCREDVINFSIMIIKLIDKTYQSRDIVNIKNVYLRTSYLDWINEIKIHTQAFQNKKKRSQRFAKPKFKLKNNEVYIEMPRYRFLDKYGYQNIKIEIYNGENLVFEHRKPNIKRIIGGYELRTNEIKIDVPLSKICYQIKVNGDVIYGSGDKLNRNIIVFDKNGTEIKNNKDYSGTVIICHKRRSKYSLYCKHKDYYLSSTNVKIGDVIRVDDSMFNFSSLLKPGFAGNLYDDCYLIDKSNNRIEIYKRIDYAFFETEYDLNDLYFQINESVKKMNQLKYTRTKKNGIYKYIIDLNNISSGIHKCKVFTISNNHKIKIFAGVFAVDNSLHFDANILNNQMIKFSVRSDFISSPINTEINIENFKKDFLKIIYHNHEYSYILPYELNIYRINGRNWIPFSTDLWIGDILSDTNIEIYSALNYEAELRNDKGQRITEQIQIKKNNEIQKFKIGMLRSYKNQTDFFMIFLKIEGKVKHVLRCYTHCIMNEKETWLRFNAIQNKLTIYPVYYGEGNVSMKLINLKSNSTFTYNCENKKEIEIYDLNSFDNYKIQFIEKYRGLSLKKERLLYEVDYVFYAYSSFQGNLFKIDYCVYEQYNMNKMVKNNFEFSNTYIFFRKQINDTSYIGDIYVKKIDGNYFMLRGINPVTITICSDVINYKVEVSITKEGDGLLLDFYHKGILNNMDDLNAPDIYSYYVNVKERNFK